MRVLKWGVDLIVALRCGDERWCGLRTLKNWWGSTSVGSTGCFVKPKWIFMSGLAYSRGRWYTRRGRASRMNCPICVSSYCEVMKTLSYTLKAQLPCAPSPPTPPPFPPAPAPMHSCTCGTMSMAAARPQLTASQLENRPKGPQPSATMPLRATMAFFMRTIKGNWRLARSARSSSVGRSEPVTHTSALFLKSQRAWSGCSVAPYGFTILKGWRLASNCIIFMQPLERA